MAPKRPSPLDDPPAASSTDEHEEPSSEEEAEAEEEDEDPSEDVEEEEEEQESQKTPQKPSASASASRSSKRAKKSGGGDGGGGGDEKKLSQRLWSEDDEIAILEGMIAFSSEKGSDPSADLSAFHEFVRSSIRVEDFTKSQLGDKVRRLRKKFANNAAKSSYDPATPHERKAFELSERIWGFADDNGPAAVPNGTPSSALPNGLASPERGGDPGVLAGVLRLQGSRLPESAVRRGLGLIPEDKKAELEAEWREIHLAELELLAQKTQLMSEQWRMIFDALKSDC